MIKIIISGPSGSGKTILSRNILKKVKNGILLSTDNYYKTGFVSKLLSIFLKNYFDRKISFNYKLFKKDLNFILVNKKSTHSYFYDFNNKKIRKSKKETGKIDYLIIEGIFARELLKNFKDDNFIFIELKTDKVSCMNRVIKRDVIERGKTKKIAERDFLKSWKYYNETIKSHTNNELEIINKENDDLDDVIINILNLIP